jgi:hypothetical protein
MALKETVNTMRKLLGEICKDLDKSGNGNKAASQRVRVNTIRLEKAAKQYRKESVASEKKGGGKSKASGAKKTPAKKATAKMPKKKR